MGGFLVGGGCYCGKAVLSYSYFRPPPLARSVDRAVDRAPPPSPGRAWADVVERPPSPDRLLGSSPAVARPASPARSLAGPRSIVRPPSLASRRSCCFENSVSHNLHKIVRVCSIFYPHEGYRSVIPLDAARVNRTIFHNNSVHRYYITRIEGRDYIQHDILYDMVNICLLYTSPSPRDRQKSRMPSSA